MAKRSTYNDTPLERAFKLAGSQRKLAELTGYSQNAIWYAAQKKRPSPEMALKIERATNGAVTAKQLRPDIFGGAA